MALSNRYPARQRGAPVKHSRPRPLPLPDNDNTPGNRKPRPLPDNDNRPGVRPPLRGGLLARAARGLLRGSIGGFVSYEVTDWIIRNSMLAAMFGAGTWYARGDWTKIDCPQSTSGQWWTAGTLCTGNQLLSPNPPNAIVKAAPGDLPSSTLNLALWEYYWNGPTFGWRYKTDARFTRASGTNAEPWPEYVPRYVIQDTPWPKNLPLPDVETWPVGVPYPVRAPAVRPGVVASGNSTRDSSSPGTRFQKETAFDPFPRRPRKGEKERKIRGTNMVQALGRGLSAYSEVGDFIDSLWDALPAYYRTSRYGEFRYRGKRAIPVGVKAMDLYENIEHIDITQALKNLVLNEIEDQIVGRLIGRTTKVFGKNLGNALVAGARIDF